MKSSMSIDILVRGVVFSLGLPACYSDAEQFRPAFECGPVTEFRSYDPEGICEGAPEPYVEGCPDNNPDSHMHYCPVEPENLDLVLQYNRPDAWLI